MSIRIKLSTKKTNWHEENMPPNSLELPVKVNFILSFDRNWYDHLWLYIASIATTISLVFHYFLSPLPYTMKLFCKGFLPEPPSIARAPPPTTATWHDHLIQDLEVQDWRYNHHPLPLFKMTFPDTWMGETVCIMYFWFQWMAWFKEFFYFIFIFYDNNQNNLMELK